MIPIKNKIFLIDGLPGEGKTFFACFLAYFYGRVYSNVDIFFNGKKKNITCKSLKDMNKITYSNTKGLWIIDEGGFNLSSRRSFSKENQEMSMLGMVSRKRNVDIAIIAQNEGNIDINFRERLSKYLFSMESYFIGKDLNFEVAINTNSKGFINLVGYKKINLILFAELTKMTYNTLEESKFNDDDVDERFIDYSNPVEQKK